MLEFPLTKNQQQVFDWVENNDGNVLITGKPGVGKSVLINSLTSEGSKTYTLAAPTGLAALNIGGRTLHSLLKLPISQGIFEHDYNLFCSDDRVINNIRYNVQRIIIDEISMVRADTFDFMDRFLQFVKGNKKPFGGIQMILVGDLFQLPPVVVGAESAALLQAGFDTPFMFSSRAWVTGKFKILQLTEVLRQKGDPKFIKLLDGARTGAISATEMKLLNKTVGTPEDLRIRLTSTNAIADEINRTMLAQIDEEKWRFDSTSFGDWPAYPVEKELFLKVGAQVMVKKNGADRPNTITKGEEFASRVVNGTLGKVIEIIDDNKVVIEIEGEEEPVTIWRKQWEKKAKRRDSEGKWEEFVVASFEQIPLALAWAISIHKSQGQSFDKVHIDASKIFMAGQTYVALSRVRSLAGLSLEVPLDDRKFKTNSKVLEFYKSIA